MQIALLYFFFLLYLRISFFLFNTPYYRIFINAEIVQKKIFCTMNILYFAFHLSPVLQIKRLNRKVLLKIDILFVTYFIKRLLRTPVNIKMILPLIRIVCYLF